MIVFMFSSPYVITICCSKVVSSVWFWLLSLSLKTFLACSWLRAGLCMQQWVWSSLWGGLLQHQAGNLHITVCLFSWARFPREHSFNLLPGGLILAVSLSGAMLGWGKSECLHSLFANSHLICLFSIQYPSINLTRYHLNQTPSVSPLLGNKPLSFLILVVERGRLHLPSCAE